MGQKVHPVSYRLPVTFDWRGKWYADKKDYAGVLHEDLKVRAFVKKKLAQAAVPKMVMDFTHVVHMSSSALGMLITLNKRVREKKGQLRLCNIQPAIYEVFAITRLNEIFQIAQTREQAMVGL